MKLDTAISNGKLIVDGTYIDHQNVEWFQAMQVSHDAALAHALIGAIDDVAGSFLLDDITARASELMKQWGFDSGEDA